MKLRNHIPFLIACASFSALALPALAAAPVVGQALNPTLAERIIASARQFVAEQPAAAAGVVRDVQIADLDPRLVLQECPGPLSAYWPVSSRTSGNTVVGVRCTDTPPWQVFVQVRIEQRQPALVASRNLARGQRLEPADVNLQTVASTALRSAALQDMTQLSGLTLKRAVAANEPLTLDAVCLICRGDQVNVAAGDERFSVSIKAVAVSDGSWGDHIDLVNSSSKRHVQAIVTGAGAARIE